MKSSIIIWLTAITSATMLPALACASSASVSNSLATITVQADPHHRNKAQRACSQKQLTAPQYIYLVAGGPPVSFSVHNSSTIAAYNIRANLAAVGFNDVTQNASNCAVLMPGGTCSIILTPGATTYGSLTSPVALPVQGDNTTVTYIAAAVVQLAVGDLWEGGMIYNVLSPTHVLIVALQDASIAPTTWDDAVTLCSNYSVTENCAIYDDWNRPPTADLGDIYNNVYLTGYLTNFQPAEYWGSETSEGSTTAYTIDFSNGATTVRDKSELHFARCIRAYFY